MDTNELSIEKVDNGFIIDLGWNDGYQSRNKSVYLTWAEVVEFIANNELKGKKVAEVVTPAS